MAVAQEKSSKKIIAIVKNIGFILICIVLGYILIGNLAANNSTIYSISHYMNEVVLTGSMEPEIKPGDYITVIKKNKDSYKVGDVVTYVRTTESGDKERVTHQIISIDGEQVITQGTSASNTNADDPITKDDILGKHILTIPKLGYVMKFLSSTTGIILIVGLILAVIFWEITEPKRDENEEKEAVVQQAKPAVEEAPKKKKLALNLTKKVQKEPIVGEEETIPKNVVKNETEIPKEKTVTHEEKKPIKAEPIVDDNDDRIDLIAELTKLREEKKRILDAQKLLDEARKKEIEDMNKKLEDALEENKNITKSSKITENAVNLQNNIPTGQGMQMQNGFVPNGYMQQQNFSAGQDVNNSQPNGYVQQPNAYVGQDINSQQNGYIYQNNNTYGQPNSFMQQEQNQFNKQAKIEQQESPNQDLNPFETPKMKEEEKKPLKTKNDRTLNLIRTLAGINITSEDIAKATGIALEKVNRLKDADRVVTIAKNLLDMNMAMNEVSLATGLSEERLKEIISEKKPVQFDENWEDERILNIARKLIDVNMSLEKIAQATGLKVTRVERIKEQYRVISIAKNLYSMGMSYEDIAHATALTVIEVKAYVLEEPVNYEDYEENMVADVVRNLLTMQMPMANIIKATSLTLEEIRKVKEDIEMEAIAKNLINMKISSKYIAEATGLTISRVRKLRSNDDIVAIAKNLLQMGLPQEEVSKIVNLPLDIVLAIKVEPLKNTDVISIDFGTVK